MDCGRGMAEDRGGFRWEDSVLVRWKTVASGSTIPAFFVEDETGALRVHPEGAELTQNLTFSYRCRRRDAFYYAKGPAKGIANSTGNRRFRENTIQVGDALYIMGQARLREDVVAPEIAADPDTGNRYIITVKSEETVGAAPSGKV